MGIFEKFFGPPDVEALKAKKDVDGLVKALAHKDWRVRRDAAQALGDLADFLGFPKGGWGDDLESWPEPWDKLLKSDCPKLHVTLPVQVKDILDEDEESIGILRGPLEYEKTVYANVDKYRVSGKVPDLLEALGMGAAGISIVETPLSFCITNKRFIVAVKPIGKLRYIAFSLRDMMGDRLDGWIKSEFEGFGSWDPEIEWWPILAFDFTDGDYVSFVTCPSGLGRVSHNPDWRKVRDEDAAVPENKRQIYVALAWWVEQRNRYLHLLRSGDMLRFDRYTQCFKALNRGGDKAVESLILWLGDSEEQVRVAGRTALERIGGPEAERALAEHRARQK